MTTKPKKEYANIIPKYRVLPTFLNQTSLAIRGYMLLFRFLLRLFYECQFHILTKLHKFLKIDIAMLLAIILRIFKTK